jgi:hypothetical protein
VSRNTEKQKSKENKENMKKYTLQLAAILFVAAMNLIAPNLQAQTTTTAPVPLDMIRSQDRLRQYALTIATNASRGVSGDIAWSYPGTVTWTNATGKYAEDALDKVFKAELSYWIINTNNPINGYAYLYDSCQDQPVFYGNAQFSGDEANNGRALYDIWLYEVPLPVNVDRAEVIALNDDGTSSANRTVLNINRCGKPRFPSWMAGSTNGLLSTRAPDGTVAIYNLWNPVGQSPKEVDESADYKIQGHYIHTGSTNGTDTTLKIVEVWNRPTVLFRIPTDQWVVIDVTGVVQDGGSLSFERTPSMERMVIGSNVTQKISLSKTGTVRVWFPKGEYRSLFEWIEFGKPNKLYTGPTDNGKG